jgi:acyl carrier protein
MTSASQLRPRFEAVLRRHLRLAEPDAAIPFEAELTYVGLDSMGTVTLLVDLEETFGVSFPGTLLTPETFRTPATLERAVASLVEP